MRTYGKFAVNFSKLDFRRLSVQAQPIRPATESIHRSAHRNSLNLGRNLGIFRSMQTVSISQASSAGVSRLVSMAESGAPVPLTRHGRVVAEVVSTNEIERLRRDSETLRDAVLALGRFATDSGERTDLDDAMEMFGFSRAELMAEIAADGESL